MTAKHVQPTEVPSWEATTLLRSTTVGRLCVIDHGTPLALPVNFQLTGDANPRIVVRTSPSGLLAAYQGPASFEADHIDEEQHRAWSVIARGELHHTYGDPTLPDPQPWLADGRFLWLVLDVTTFSARRFTAIHREDEDFAVEWSVDG